MSRLPQVNPGQLERADRAAYDRLLDGFNSRPGYVRQTQLDGIYGLMAHSPELAARVCAVGDQLLGSTGIEVIDKEITCLAVAREANCQFEWTLHEPKALSLGVRNHVIQGIKSRCLDGFTDRERLVTEFSWGVVRNRVADETWVGMHDLLGDQGVVNLTLQICFVALICQCMETFGLELAVGVEPLLPVDR